MLVELKAKESTIEKSEPALNLFSANPDSAEMRRVTAWLDGRFKTAKKVMTSETVTITPAMAEYILKRCNTGNRPLRELKINQYAEAMKEGNFVLTSQSISFSPDGMLNNGQHRLFGIVRSGMNVRIYVTFGEPRDAFHVIDTGAVRGGADVLHISGHKNVNVLAASARLLQNVQDDVISGKYSNKDVMDIVDANPRLVEATSSSAVIHKKFHCPSAAPAVACYLIITKSAFAHKLPEFIARLIDGSNLEKNSPILKLREGLLQRTLGGDVNDTYSRSANVAASMVMAWNLWARGRSKGGVIWDMAKPFPSVA